MPRRCAAVGPGQPSTRLAAAAAGPSAPSGPSWLRSSACQSPFAPSQPSPTMCERVDSCCATSSRTRPRPSRGLQAIVADRGYRGLANLIVPAQAPQPGHQGSAARNCRLHAHRPTVAGRERLCPARPRATANAVLRRKRGERADLARRRLGRLHAGAGFFGNSHWISQCDVRNIT
jgi:hypothetical protein